MISFFKSFKKEYFWVPKEEREKDISRVGLVQLAMPIVFENLLRSTVGMIDIVFLSRISDTVVSAVSIANKFIAICMILATAMATGATVCINQAIGMKNNTKVNLFATIGLCANAITGVIFGLMFSLCPNILLKIMQLDQTAKSTAMVYMRIAGGLMIFQVLEIMLVNLCRSMGIIRAPLFINIISNLVNIVGNYLAVFHGNWFGNLDPVVGVAIATVLSRFTALCIAWVLVHQVNVKLSFKYLCPFPKKDFKLVLSLAIPGGINSIAYSLGQIVTTSVVTILGLTIVAAKVYVENIVQYIALIGISFSQASALMVGYRIGANKIREAKEVCSIVTKFSVFSNIVISLIVFALRIPLLHIFTQDEQIVQIASAVFWIDFFVEIGRAINNAVHGALQAGGDVRFQLVVNQSCAWLISVGGSYLLGIVFKLGLKGVWIAFACDELIRGTILLLRWKSEKWLKHAAKNRKVIALKDE